MPNVQQIEAAVGQRDALADAAPLCHALPQFIAADEVHPLLSMLELSGTFMAMTFAVFVLYGLFAARVRDRVVTRPRVMTWLRRCFAGGFAVLGIRLAFAER